MMSHQAPVHDLQLADNTPMACPPEGSLPRPERGFTVVRILLGVLLLTAAGLKLYGLNVTALPGVGWFATPRVQVAAAVWELVLGIWLLSGAYRAGAWLAAISTFLTFAGVSSYFGWTGVASCGCFGVIRASPWTAFGVDMAALILLAVARPDLRADAFRLPAGVSTIAAGAAATLLTLTGAGSWVYGSPHAALARLRGESLTVSHDYVDFGSGSAGQVIYRAVKVWNWSDGPVRLTGGTSNCTCVTTEDLPLTIPPGEARPITVRMKIPAAKLGMITRGAELWTDHDEQRTIRLQLGCRVIVDPGVVPGPVGVR
jgi:hypothetical protein